MCILLLRQVAHLVICLTKSEVALVPVAFLSMAEI
jgi:hypothetical protein